MNDRQKLQQLQDTWKQITLAAKKLPEYKLLMQRRYVNPKSYEPYEKVVKTIASQVGAGYQVPWNLLITDFVAANATAMSTQVAQAQAPVYWLSLPLLGHFSTPIYQIGSVACIQRVIHLGVLMRLCCKNS